MELVMLNGMKIGTIMRKKTAVAGSHSFMWNGKILEGKALSSTYVCVLHLKSPGGAVSRLVHCNLNR